MIREKTCCFTGHRPQKLPWAFDEKNPKCIEVRNKTKAAIENAIKHGYLHFISGMALGFDIIAAELVLESKKKHPDITLECAIPCADQEIKWSETNKKRYKKITSHADEISLISQNYSPDCMMKRNKYMIDNSALVIALFNGEPGGTANTVKYASKKCSIQIIPF